jgi:hypothetical protein
MASLAVVTPTLCAGVGAMPRDWTTSELDVDGLDETQLDVLGPRIDGSVRTLLDVTAGRADVPRTVSSGQMRFHDVQGLLLLAPLVEQVPGIPGRGALMAGVRAVNAVGSLIKMLPFGRQQ